ncbi:glutathione S-transferase [Ramaria rubella]|nr:glutathione S-transferase [Ramaria rubella]
MATQITVFAHGDSPNPLKVAILLEELGLDYVPVNKDYGDGPNGVKHPDFLKINPNGRTPAIIDHTNNDLVVWESGAILLYLAERFDKSGKFAGNSLEERKEVWEWLIYQVSGLGPSQGQAFWFLHAHPVKDLHPSVAERYINECLRIFSVLEKRLEEKKYLALERFTLAGQLAKLWIHSAWYATLDLSKFPQIEKWFERVTAFPSVRRVYERISAASVNVSPA